MLRVALVVLAVASSTACKRDSGGLTSKPRAIELGDEAEPAAAASPAASAGPAVPVETDTVASSTRSAAPASARSLGPFPLPVIAGAVVESRYDPVIASTRELSQLVIQSSRPMPELVAYYERALGAAGYDVTTVAPTPEEQVLLQGKSRRDKGEAMVVVMRSPTRDANVVSMTVTRMVKP